MPETPPEPPPERPSSAAVPSAAQCNGALRCAQGHTWQRPPLAAGQVALCPICGLVLQTVQGQWPAMDLPPASLAPTDMSGQPWASEPPRERGRFRIIQQHAQGGLGTISLARDQDLEREVALKEIRPELSSSRHARERFLNEARITGQLEHPNIVPVYALGWDGAGQPYYAMKLVRGRTLEQAIEAYHQQPSVMGLRQLLRSFLEVCQAMAYAHSRGVVHRDLKPANILLGDFGETLVVDWGVAKRAGDGQRTDDRWASGPDWGSPLLTQPGSALGTTAYMAPEQAKDPATAGPAADVYSLGAVLWQLLIGRPPKAESERLPRELGALGAVAQKAMAAAPAQRYGDARQLAAEVEHWLADEPVSVWREPMTKRLGRWARHHKPAVAAGLALLVTALAALLISNVLVARQRDATKQALQEKESALLQRGEALHEADRQAHVARQRLYASLMATGESRIAAGRPAAARGALREAGDLAPSLGLSSLPATVATFDSYEKDPPPLLGPEVSLPGFGTFGQAPDQPCPDCGEPHRALSDISFLADRQAIACTQHGLRLYDARTGRPVGMIHSSQPLYHLAVTADGRAAMTLGTSEGQRVVGVRLWDLTTGQAGQAMPGHVGKWDLSVSGDGRFAASYGVEPPVRIWDLFQGREITERFREALSSPIEDKYLRATVAFSPDSGQMAIGFSRNLRLAETPRLIDLQTGEIRRFTGSPGKMQWLAFSEDGHTLLSQNDGEIVAWDVATATERMRMAAGHVGGTARAALLPRRRQVVTGGNDGVIRWHDFETGAQVGWATAGNKPIQTIAPSPDGRMLLAMVDGQLQLRAAAVGGVESHRIRGHDGMVFLAVSPDGRLAVSGSDDGTVKAWDVPSGQHLRTFLRHTGEVAAVAVSPDGRTVLSGGEGNHLIRRWDLVSGKETGQLAGHEYRVTGIEFSPDGQYALSCDYGGAVHKWNIADGRQVRLLSLRPIILRDLSFAPDGRTFAVTSLESGTIRCFDAETFKQVGAWEHGTTGIMAGVISPDGRLGASADLDGSVVFWDAVTGKCIRRQPGGSSGGIAGLAFLQGGRTVVTGGGRLRFWSADEGPLGAIALGGIRSVAVPQDGQTVLIGGGDGTIHVFDLARPQRYRAFESLIPRAQAALVQDENNPQALRVFGDWYAFRGIYDWAAQFYEQARAHGAEVSSLELGRCYWRLNRLPDARRELERALERGEAPADYLRICLNALQQSDSATVSSPADWREGGSAQ